jgi:hypothetical protein
MRRLFSFRGIAGAAAVVLGCAGALVAAAAAAAPAAAPATLDALERQLAAVPTTRAQFAQVRKIKGMVRPLRSSGHFIASREHGLWWRQEKPFGLTLVLDAKRMSQTLDGQPPEIITAEKQPQLFQFNHLLIAIFKADRAALEKSFSATFTPAARAGAAIGHIGHIGPISPIGDVPAAAPTPAAAPAAAAQWQLALVPTQPPLDKVFRKITLRGKQHVEDIVIEDRRGDETTLRFFNHQTAPETLSENEQKKFSS